MNLARLLLLLLLLLFVCFLVMWLVPPIENGQGTDHPSFPVGTLKQSAAQRTPISLLLAGTFYGALTYVFAVTCMMFGIPADRRKHLVWFFIAAGIVCALSVMLVGFLHERAHTMPTEATAGTKGTFGYLGAFPVATAVMLYAVPAAPFLFVLFYAVSFERWIMSPEAERTFERLVAQRSSRET